MKRTWVRVVLAALIGLLTLAAWVAWPRGYGAVPVPTSPPGWDGPMGRYTYGGVVHVHVERSFDSYVTLQGLVDAARVLPVSFLVVTDHEAAQPLGDVRARYQDGVFILAGTEWSPDDGHLIDLSPTPGTGPYPFMKDALPDCKARGGPCVAAHPSTWRRRFWPPLTGVDGLEIHSALTAVGSKVRFPFVDLAWTGFQLLLNPGLALWRVGSFQPDVVEIWEAYAQVQPLSAWCGADLHGLMPLRENLLSFMTLVSTEKPLSQDPLEAAAQLRGALQHGACVNQLAGFVDGITLHDNGKSVVATARIRSPNGAARLLLIHRGKTVATMPLVDGETAQLGLPGVPGPWRAVVEVDAPGLWGTVTQAAAITLLQVPPAL